MTRDRARSSPEWVTLIASCLVLLVVVAVVVREMVEPRSAAAPEAVEVGRRKAPDGSFHVEVAVRNGGDETATDVQVGATLEVSGETTDADQVVAFLAGGEEARVVFVFTDDPADGDLTVEVISYRLP